MIPGNFLRDNWFMGNSTTSFDTLGDFLDKIEGFSKEWKLRDKDGRRLTIRIGEDELIIETYKEKP